MTNVIYIDDFKNKQKLKIEEKAYEQYGAIKIDEDLYIAAEASFDTGSPELESFFKDELEMDIEEVIDLEVINEINNLIEEPGERLNIMILEEDEELITFEIFNIRNNKKFAIGTQIVNDFDSRRMFTGIIAGAIKKDNVNVTFFLKLTYEDLEHLYS